MPLILLVLGLLGIAVVAVVWGPLNSAGGALGGTTTETRLATATVVESAPCATATQGDLVEVRVDGTTKRARFDGCGHSKGQELRVRVPVNPEQDFVVQAASDSGGDAAETELATRVSWVLITLAGVAGGGYALMIGAPARRVRDEHATRA